jgi:hypothetical protein
MNLRRPLLATARLALPAALSAGLALAAVAAGTGGVADHRPAPDTTLATAASTDDPVDHVIAISVDGLNPEAIRRLGRTGTPALHRLMANGASTLNARSEYERTITLPNHTGMLTGRHVLGAGGHQVTFNDDNGSTLQQTSGGYVRGIFDVVHNRGGSTAFYSAKHKFDYLDRSWDGTHGDLDRVGADDGRDKIDRYHVDTEPANVTRLIARLRTAPDDFSFVHLAHPDRAGHAYGFMSARYLTAVTQADEQVGRILDALNETGLRAHTDVVLTADHGGRGPNHSDPTQAYNYTVPFMVWGVGVPRGADLYTLNADVRSRPGTGRPTYAGRQPIRNGEVANLTADLLDLPRVPGSAFDTRQDLRVR